MTDTLPKTTKKGPQDQVAKRSPSARAPRKNARAAVNEIRCGIDPGSKDENGKPIKLLAFEVNQIVTMIIVDDMQHKGKFFREDDLGYYLDNNSHQLTALGNDSVDLSRLLRGYNLNSTEATYKYVAEELYLHSTNQGEKATVHRFSHLRINDGAISVIYILAEGNQVYRVTKDSVKVVANGTDGVLFESSKYYAPKGIPKKPVINGLFKSLILDIIPFNTDKLTIEECQLDFLCWTLSVFMRELIKDKTILAMIGPKGSGKTTAIRAIGETLYGPTWDVMPVGREERDFDTVITTLDLIGLDNVDGMIGWFNDKLAVIATGGTIAKRILHTTNRLAEFRIRAMVALSSRTPKFRRDDVAERLRIMELMRIEEVPGMDFGSDILKPIQENRIGLWEDLLAHAQGILRVIDETDWRSIQVPKSRMQEYARFTVIAGQALGCEPTARSLAIKQRELQDAFVIEIDIFLTTLLIWVRSNGGVKVTAKQLDESLKEIAESRGEVWPYSGGQSLGQKLRHNKVALEAYMYVTEGKDKSLNQTMYSFTLRNQTNTGVDSVSNPEVIPTPQIPMETDIPTPSRNDRNDIDSYRKEENKRGNKNNPKKGWISFRSFRFPWSTKERND